MFVTYLVSSGKSKPRSIRAANEGTAIEMIKSSLNSSLHFCESNDKIAKLHIKRINFKTTMKKISSFLVHTLIS